MTKSAVTMRLVNTETYLLSDHSVGQTPPFATLSHRLISSPSSLLSLVQLVPLANDIDYKRPSVASDDSNQPSHLFPSASADPVWKAVVLRIDASFISAPSKISLCHRTPSAFPAYCSQRTAQIHGAHLLIVSLSKPFSNKL